MPEKNAKKAINRAAVARRVARRLPGRDARTADRFVALVFEAVGDALVEGRRVELRGFGAFWTKTLRARVSRNPRTGETGRVGPRRAPAFRPGDGLRRALIEVEARAAAAAPPSESPKADGGRGGAPGGAPDGA